MNERELQALKGPILPILQRTAPAEGQNRARITPASLDVLAWGVVLAYAANAGQDVPPGIPRRIQAGEGPLRDEEVRAGLAALRDAAARPRLKADGRARARFTSAARGLLEASGWSPARASQAADEMAAALGRASRG